VIAVIAVIGKIKTDQHGGNKKPLLPRGQEGCVWLEKVTELIVAAASGPAGQWCWAEKRVALPEQIAEQELR
jgi:hypothetical protein